jgi:RimJ/RimL family protein N-acetyltransferase
LITEQVRTVHLKNGQTLLVRTYTPEDFEKLVSFYAGLSPETLRWSLPPYDRPKIQRWTLNLENSIMLLALYQDKIVGHLYVYQQAWNQRLRGNGELIIYLHQDYQGVGLGTAMMREAIELSKQKGLHRLALSVIADNHNAIKLYEKVGFQHEGRRHEDYLGEDGKYHDVLEMGLLL